MGVQCFSKLGTHQYNTHALNAISDAPYDMVQVQIQPSSELIDGGDLIFLTVDASFEVRRLATIKGFL